jgi:hypothetical protein
MIRIFKPEHFQTPDGIYTPYGLAGMAESANARLICVEPLEKKCEHQHVHAFYVGLRKSTLKEEVPHFQCLECKKSIEPTGWREIQNK